MDWIRPRCPGNRRESLWWMTHRFLVLNRPTRTELQREFGLPWHAPANVGLLDCALSRRLGGAGASWISWERLCAATGAHSVPLHWPVVPAWGVPFSSRIRFCEACLSAGFHSIMFGAPCLTHCPIHALPLRDGCVHCHGLLPTRLDPAQLAAPGQCRCGWRFLSVSVAVRGPLPMPGMARLDMYAGWLQAQAPAMARALARLTSSGASRQAYLEWCQRWTSRLPAALRVTQGWPASAWRPAPSVPDSARAWLCSTAWPILARSALTHASGTAENTANSGSAQPACWWAQTAMGLVSVLKALRRHILGPGRLQRGLRVPPVTHPLADHPFAPRSRTPARGRMLWGQALASYTKGACDGREPAPIWPWLQRAVRLPGPEMDSGVSSWLLQHLVCELALRELKRCMLRVAASGTAPWKRSTAGAWQPSGLRLAWDLDAQGNLRIRGGHLPMLALRHAQATRQWRCCLGPDATWRLRRGQDGQPSSAPGTLLSLTSRRYARRMFKLSGPATVLQSEHADIEVLAQTCADAVWLQRQFCLAHERLMTALDRAVPPSPARTGLSWYLPERYLHRVSEAMR